MSLPKSTIILILKTFSLLFIFLLFTACSNTTTSNTNDNHTHNHSHEQPDHIHIDPPPEFSALSNPYADNAEAIKAGQTIFQTNCTACHGPNGEGDGPAADTLTPKPVNLTDTAMMAMVSDGYLFWRISEGGANPPFNSMMPTWKQTLSEDEMWQVVTYVRSLSNP